MSADPGNSEIALANNGINLSNCAMLVGVIAMLALLLMVTLSWMGKAAWSTYQTSSTTRIATNGADDVIAGICELMIERAYTDEALRLQGPANPRSLEAIGQHRRAAQEFLGNRGLPAIVLLEPVRAKRQAIENFANSMDALRKRVDEALRVPRAQRDPQLLEHYRPNVTNAIRDAIAVWQLANHATSNVDPTVKELGLVKLLAWQTREIASHERASITAALASNVSISEATLAANAKQRANIDLLWSQIEDIVGSSVSAGRADHRENTPLQLAVARARERYFVEFRALADTVARTLGENRARPLSGATGTLANVEGRDAMTSSH